MGLMGLARALSSGPAEAWYVDTVQAHAGPDADLRTGLARGSSATSAALALGTLLGGGLPWVLGLAPGLGEWLADATGGLVIPLSVPALLGALVEIVFVLYVVSSLPEPPRPRTTVRQVVGGVPAAVAAGLRLGARDVLIRRVLLTASAASPRSPPSNCSPRAEPPPSWGPPNPGPSSSPGWPAPDSSAPRSAANSPRSSPGSQAAVSARCRASGSRCWGWPCSG